MAGGVGLYPMSGKPGSPARTGRDPARVEAEHQLALVFNSARDMMLLARVDPAVVFRVVSVNRTYLETVRGAGFDFVAGDFEGRTFYEKESMFGASAVSTAQNQARYQQVLATLKPVEFEEITLTPKGTFYGRTTITPILDEDGKCGFFLYSSQDVTDRVWAQQAQRESEAKFAKVFRSSPDAMSVHDLENGRYVDANEALLRMFGYTREELIGRTATELGVWANLAERDVFVTRLRREGSVRDFPLSMRTRRGEIRFCELSADVIDLGGQPHNVSVLRDITDSRRKDEALRENRRLLSTLMDNLPGMSYRSRNDPQWTMEFVSEGSRALTGYPPADLIGNRRVAYGDLIVEEDRLGVWDEVQAALAERRAFEIVYRIRRAGGSLMWVWERGQGVFGEGAAPEAIEGFITDITARKSMEEALRESENRFASAFRASPDLIVITDYETGQYLEVNNAQVISFGYTREEMLGKTPQELGFIEDNAVRDQVHALLARDGHVRDLKVTGRSRDGRTIVISLSAEIIMVGGRKCMLRVSRDVTVAAQAEQALRESEAKFATAFRSSPHSLTISEAATGRYIDVNLGFERLSGFKREEVIGRTSDELGIWENPAARDELMRQLGLNGRVRDMEIRFRARDGSVRITRCSCESVDLAGLSCVLNVVEDITEQRHAEQALRESEERVSGAFRASPDAMSIADFETGLYLEVNEGFERMFGYPRAEAIGRSALDLNILFDPAVSEQVRRQVEANGRVRDIEVAVRTRSGEARTVLHSVEKIQLGGRQCVLRVSRDITERKRAEQVLRQSEEKFAKAFRASPNAISITELITGKFVDVNEGFERLSGYKREQLIGHSTDEFQMWVDPGDRTRMLEELERAGFVRNMRTRIRSQGGLIRDFLISVETVEIGRQTCLVILGHDISEQMLAEKALRESEEKFAIAFRASPVSLTIVELATGRFIEVNHSFERITGYTREETIGRTTLELGLWPNGVGREAFAGRLDREGIVRNLIVVFRTRDGRDIHTRLNSEVIQLGGQRCILSLIEDISEEHRAEEEKALLEAQLRQSQKLEALGTLAGGIAHDFNNILTAIVVNQELAVMDIDNPVELRDRLSEISRASNRAKDLVRQILAFSRQQSESVRVKQRLASIVQEAMALLRASLPSTIEIEQDLSVEAPPALVDATQLHQVVMNLCTNAAHAMRDRPGKLKVRLAARSLDETQARALSGLAPGAYTQVTISDTGHGMTKAVLARIFEPFFTTKGPGEGTGLGLAVVHGIMKDHGGGIFVESTPDVGTQFDLFFPAAPGSDDAPVVTQENLMFGYGESVLLIDDEPSVCDAVSAMLRKLNYRVESFTDPEQGLARFQETPAGFDLLLTDRTMPRLTGPQLISLLQAVRPGLPALVMSGLSSRDAGGSNPPAVSYRLVSKPLDIVELSRAVRAALAPPASS